MKILHVITTINRGGAENHLVALVRGQREQGCNVAVAYLKGDGYWAEELGRLGVAVTPLDLRRYGDVRPWFKLRRLVRTFSPDIVHAHMPPAELYVRLALISDHHVKLVISKHNDEPFFRGLAPNVVGRWVARRADRIIAISEAVRTYVTGPTLACDPARTFTVHYGIDPMPYEIVDAVSRGRKTIRAEWDIEADMYCVGTVARLVPQKALHVLLEGFAKYRRMAALSARLVIVGEGGLDGDLRWLARQLGVSDHVVWAGKREDIPEVMSAFDVFALTSIYEGFGLVLLEAMSAARPIVATAVSAIPEIVKDGETGRLVRSGDAVQVANALKFFESTENRARAGSAGRLRAKSQFSVARMVTATIQVYAQVHALKPERRTAV